VANFRHFAKTVLKIKEYPVTNSLLFWGKINKEKKNLKRKNLQKSSLLLTT
jgi:hypothetical protein